MYILVHGEDTYRAKKKVEGLLKGTAPDFFDFFDRPDFSFSLLKDILSSGSLFDKQKTIVLRNVFSNSKFREEFLKEAKDLKDTNDLIIFFETRKMPVKEGVIAFLKKFGKVFELKALKPPEINAWIKKQATEMGCSINDQALTTLIKVVGNDLWRMSTEIQKLATYGFGDKEIKKQDVELLVKTDVDAQIFKTIEAIASRDKKTALQLLYNHLEKGDSPFYLLTMITYQFRNLIIVKGLEDISVLKGKMHPFVISKSRQLSQKFTKEQLEKIYSKIFKMDFAIKRGKIKPEMALELLVADI